MTPNPKGDPRRRKDPEAHRPSRDDEELGLEDDLIDEIDDGDERVGLDDAVGVEDGAPLFDLELPPEEPAEEGTDDGDPLAAEGLDLAEDEYGWTDDGRGDSGEWDASELDLEEMAPLGHDDGGAEGVEEALDLTGLGGPLPALDQEEVDEAEEDPYGLELPTLSTSALELPAAYDGAVCRAMRLTPEIGIRCALVTSREVWAVGDAIFSIVDGRAERVAGAGLEERSALSMAVGDDGHRLVVGTDRGVARSVDRGKQFQLLSALASDTVRLLREEGNDRIWAYAGAGALHKSEDLGSLWSGPLLLRPVVALAGQAGGGVLALCAGRSAPPQLARSSDGGQRWAAANVPELALPEDPESARWSLAAAGDVVVLACSTDRRGPLLSNDRGVSFERAVGLPAAEALAVRRERGGVSIYAAHRSSDGRALLVRHRPDGGDGGTLLELPTPAASIEHIALAPDRGGAHVVFVATSVGLYRVELDEDVD
ncbi:MAG: WD40/YVTN/BNR-like repeat-containing protein [Sandaracinaceae bacterium]